MEKMTSTQLKRMRFLEKAGDDNTTRFSLSKKQLMQHLKAFFCIVLLFSWMGNATAQYCSPACNDGINLSIGANCEAEIYYDMILENGDNSSACNPNGYQAFMVIIEYPAGTNTYDPPNIVDETHIGYELTVKVKHWATGNFCWGYVTVEDKQMPLINCPNDITIACSDPLPAGNLPASAITECSDYTQTYQDNYIDIDCSFSNLTAQIIRTWTVTDAYGNANTCSQTISIDRATLADVEAPINYDGSAYPDQPALECGAQTGTDVIPGPTVNGHPIINGGTCDLAVTSSDQIIELCGGSFKIIRTWTVADWCAGTVANFPQLIKVADHVAPSITCPGPLNGTSNYYSCDASVNIPAVQVNDGCSNPVSVTVSTPFGTINGNGGSLGNVPFGTHTVTYVATDACGNSSQCTTTVTVGDNTPPIAVCDQFTVVSLTNQIDGTTQVCAEVFDDGSYDNCGVVDFQVKRMDSNGPFSDCIFFDCGDVGTVIMVQFRVYDAAGNYNECMVEAEVQDKTNPTVTCPPDITLDCNADYTDLNVTGQAGSFDNCSATVSHDDFSIVVDNCGEGLVRRRWTVSDANGNTVTCVQNIYLVNDAPFNGNSIVWPADPANFDGCTDSGDLDPDDLNPPFDRPVLSGDNCDMIASNHTDEVLYLSGDACYKILRTWVVVDWCQYNPNDPNTDGRWEHVQVIKVTDDEAPVLTVPADVDYGSVESNCGSGNITITPATATDCNPDVVITNNSPYAASNGADASGNYPYGTTTVTFTANDGCGNETTATVDITVYDAKLPTPVCQILSTTVMPSSGSIAVWASDFEAGSSYDNCTAYENLTFFIRKTDELAPPNNNVPSTTSVTFDCTELGTQYVDMWVCDEAGNCDHCRTHVVIQDPNGACATDPTLARIAGVIKTTEGEEVESVEVGISENNMDAVITNNDGSYEFENLAMQNNYTITPWKNMNPLNGVSTFDLIILQKHILGIDPISSPYRMIAGDINDSGAITTIDLVVLRKLILSIYSEFPSNTSWRFIDSDFVFPANGSPLATIFPEVFNVNSLETDELDADFVAIKIGDMNNSAIPNNTVQIDNRTAGDFELKVKEENILPNEEYVIDITAGELKEILGYQFTLEFDRSALDFVKIEKGDVDNFGLTHTNEGIITTSWASVEEVSLYENDVLFSLRFKGRANAKLSSVLKLSSRVTNAEAYTTGIFSDDQQAGLLGLALTFDQEAAPSSTFQLHQNLPNPFKSNTSIGFELPEASQATLTIYDVSGKVLKQINGDFAKGYHQVNLSEADLSATGVLFYRLDAADFTATRKMILID